MENTPKFIHKSICRVLFSYTTELARRGNYKEAEESLGFILEHDSSPEYFLLLGKIYAQQGRYSDAIIEWKKTLETNPENREANAAISKAEKLKAPLPSQVSKLKWIAGFCGMFLVLGICISIYLLNRKDKIIVKDKNDFHSLSIDYRNIQAQLQENKKKYHELAKQHNELERVIGDQIVTIYRIGEHLQIKGLTDLEITIKQERGHVKVYGEVPTMYLKKKIQKVIEKTGGVESANFDNIEITHKYTVSAGDVLSSVAEKITGDHRNLDAISKKNNIKNPDNIQKGEIITLPNSL